jgi:hypothetical protein
MRYFYVEPDVAGGFGPNTVIDRGSGRIVVKKLHYIFDGWFGDDLLESTPAFLVSQRLAEAIHPARFCAGARLFAARGDGG